MDCHEVKEHISAAVDNRLESDLKNAFEEHIAQCTSCRNEFELERLTKKYIQGTLVRAAAPTAVSRSILSDLGSAAETETTPSWISRLWSQPRLKPAFALGIIAILAMVLFVSLPLNTRHLHTSPNDNDIVHQSLNNFDAVVAGTLKPQVASSDPAKVKSFFAKTVNYEVEVPHIKKCKLIGGFISSYQGKPLAHLVYKHDNQVVYLYQVDMQTVLEGTSLTLPANAKEELLRTGWYVQSPQPKCSLVMWLIDNTLCTAVADMDKTELIASLSYSNEKE